MEQEISLKIMDYLKKFKNHSEYEAIKNSLLNPNVSYCANQADVHYKVKDYRDEYLTFEALESGTFSFSLNSIQYSVDSGETWATLTTGNSTPTVAAGDTIMWKQTGLTPTTASGIGTFYSSCMFNARGNIMSLYYGDDFKDKVDLTGKPYAFRRLFQNNGNIIDASNLCLPATTLSESCYRNFFNCPGSVGVSNLLYAPKILPAMTLTDSCYNTFFQNCWKLKTAPKLPATTLAPSCYLNMFWHCEDLEVAPELPAMTIPASAYTQMFGWTSISIAPELPAMNLGSQCYKNMFQNCGNITVTPNLPATVLSDECYRAMFYGCANLTVATDLPATTLANGCYQGMFSNCSKLTVAPKLPAATLTNNCYGIMFSGCTNLTTAPELSATTLAYACYASMFKGCTNLVTVQSILPATTLAVSCYDGMFWECSNLKILPELPATTLTNGCYAGMFRGTAVEESPILSASTLVTSCYSHLFMECPNIKKVTCLATDVSAEKCIEDWITGNGQNGTFVKAPSMTSWPSGTSGIPNGWTVKDAA